MQRSSERVIACPAPYDSGGLGRHLRCMVEEARAHGLRDYFCIRGPADDPLARVIRTPAADWAMKYSPLRFSPGWKALLATTSFDRAVARRLLPGRVFSGFAGAADATFRRARQLRYGSLELESPTSHVSQVRRQHGAAYRAWPIEDGWLNEAYVRRALHEYHMADEIIITSEYARQSFVAAGIEAQKLRRRSLRVDERFRPPPHRMRDGTFRVVYVGGLSVVKGIPVLLEAFARLSMRAELTLVGGWSTRAMRRHVETQIRGGRRILVRPGDPLPHLQHADVYVHPAYQEGLGLAPLEAMACGVPVVVTEDTGMKEHVVEGVNGYVIPTGDSQAIVERLEAIWQACA